METTPTRTTPLPVRDNRPLAVNTNVSSTAFWDRIQNNRALAIQLGLVALALVGLIALVAGVYSYRSNAATAALAEAMQIYDTPVSTPEQPVPPSVKSYSSVEARARAANARFADVASRYGLTVAGRNAQYLQGVTAMQSGDNASAERLLKKSAGDWNHDVATLAQLSLASLYHATGRDSLAVEAYQKIVKSPSTLVPAGLAQLQLASLYESEGKAGDAKKLYAEIKDKNPKSAAAEIATQKLTGTAAE